MKLRSLHAFVPFVALSFGLPARALTTETYNYNVGSVAIPDGNPAGYANAQTPASSINVITNVTVSLNISGGYNGDLYAYLTHATPGGTGFTVLLNRVGSTTLNPFGYSDSGFNVTLSDTAANGDIHIYQTVVNPLGGAITGTWQPDGRNIDPDFSLNTTPRTTQLASFNGLSALGGWTLFVADVSGGSVSTINSWSMTVQGISSPFYWKGGNSGIWNDVSPGSSNWATDATGATPILAAPDPNADVIFSATGAANRNTTLGADLSIKSLTVNDPAAVMIGGSNTLTIGGSSGTTGLTVNAGAGLLTVNANLTLAGTSNTVTVNNAAGAVINGVVGGSVGLTKAGSGMLTLSNAANTYTGQTILGAGVLSIGSVANGGVASGLGASGSAATNLLFNGGSLQYTGASSSTNRGFAIAAGQTATFDITQAASNLTLSGPVPATSGGLTKIGPGSLTLSGVATYTGTTNINSGTFANTGTLSSGSMTNQGTFVALGSQTITGNFTNTASATLQTTVPAVVSPGVVDGNHPINVSGLVDVSGVISLTNTNIGVNAAGSSYNIIKAPPANYQNYGLIVVALDTATFGTGLNGIYQWQTGQVLIGSQTQNAGKPSEALPGLTVNQTRTYASLFDDEYQRGVTNATFNANNGTWTFNTGNGGLDSTTSVSLQNAINNIGLLPEFAANSGALLNLLSPEVYIGLSDYATQATRAHQRTAFDAPAVASGAQPVAGNGQAASAPTSGSLPRWEVFAAADFFNVSTNNSENGADYGLTSYGAVVGTRTKLTDRIKLAAYLAGDEGDVRGSLIDATGNGWSAGLLGEALLDEAHGTRLTAGVSYGRYSFDGNRTSMAATSFNTFAPGTVHFSGLDTDSLELSLGIETVAFHTDGFRLIPSADLHYATGSVGAFRETTGATSGSPIALVVNRINNESLMAEASLIAEADVTGKLTLRGQAGVSSGLRDQSRSVTARFADGSRPMTMQASGLSDNAVFLGFGATYRFTDAVSLGLNYRAEFRSGSNPYNSVNLGVTMGF